MLDHILRKAQAFERRHGICPNVVFINHNHYRELINTYPDLFGDDQGIELGFRVAVVSTESAPHPQVAWLPPRFPELYSAMMDPGSTEGL